MKSRLFGGRLFPNATSSSGAISGGNVSSSFNTTVFLGIAGILVIMAGLMWGGQIQFASSQDLNITASVLTGVAILVMFYVLYTVSAAASACSLL
jgi:hypothetical protein